MKKIAYISGQYSNPDPSKQGQNINNAADVAKEYWKKGYAVICPHLNTAWFDNTVPYKDFLEGDIEIMLRCDVVIMLPGWENSHGAKAEHKIAKLNNKEIIYEVAM